MNVNAGNSKIKCRVLIDIMKDRLHLTQNRTIVFYFIFILFCSVWHSSVFNYLKKFFALVIVKCVVPVRKR